MPLEHKPHLAVGTTKKMAGSGIAGPAQGGEAEQSRFPTMRSRLAAEFRFPS